MQTLLQRICWNLHDWRKPSGVPDDSGNPGKHGWGNEEWNFRTEDMIRGYVFGFLRYKPSENVLRNAGSKFDIGFWTIDPDTRRRWLVGFYHNAAPVSELDRKVAHRAFRDQGIYKRRIEELESLREVMDSEHLKAAKREVLKSVTSGILNFKCRVQDIEFLSAPIRLGKKVGGKHLNEHYITPTLLSRTFQDLSLQNNLVRTKTGGAPPLQAPLAEDGYLRLTPASAKNIIPRHNLLLNAFAKWLRARKFKSVVWEKGCVDIKFRDATSSWLAELKICNGMEPRKAIREALGQLLEYNLYGRRVPAENWLILLDEQPKQADRKYLNRLARELSMPLSIGWKTGSTFDIDVLQRLNSSGKPCQTFTSRER
jgi:hypothetical protein